MRSFESRIFFAMLCLSPLALSLTSCSTTGSGEYMSSNSSYSAPIDFNSRVPSQIATREKTVIVNPRVHVWAAYGSDGQLVKAGQASAGSDYCPDLGRACHTRTGTFRVFTLGNESCISHKFPIPRGGAPMPYCMYFSGGQALHGVSANEVGDGNFSHGCVRLHVSDAEWLRFNFVNIGTKVIVQPYY